MGCIKYDPTIHPPAKAGGLLAGKDKDMSDVLLYLNSHPQVTIVTIRNFLLQNKDFIEFVKTQMIPTGEVKK